MTIVDIDAKIPNNVGLADDRRLQRALESGPLPEPVQRETLRLQVEAAYLAGDCGAVRHHAGALPDLGQALRLTAGEWVARCAFEERTFGGALVPEEPFR